MADRVEVIDKSTPFQGYFRIDRYVLRHRRFDGEWTRPMTREIFERGHAVGVLLYDPDRDVVGLIEQFRPGALAAGWNPWVVEIVAGIIEEGETLDAVARRESREEAGIEIGNLVPMLRYLVSPGGTTESTSLYCGRIGSTKLDGVHGVPEENEDIRVFTLTSDEAFAWVTDGRVCNGMGIIALQWLALNRATLRERWISPASAENP